MDKSGGEIQGRESACVREPAFLNGYGKTMKTGNPCKELPSLQYPHHMYRFRRHKDIAEGQNKTVVGRRYACIACDELKKKLRLMPHFEAWDSGEEDWSDESLHFCYSVHRFLPILEKLLTPE